MKNSHRPFVLASADFWHYNPRKQRERQLHWFTRKRRHKRAGAKSAFGPAPKRERRRRRADWVVAERQHCGNVSNHTLGRWALVLGGKRKTVRLG